VKYPFGSVGISIGRGSKNGIVIHDRGISRQHARILVAAGKCWVRDENSASGTYINNHRVQGQQEIRPGDILRIGSMNFRLDISVATTAQHATLHTGKPSKAVILLAFAGVLAIVLMLMVAGGRGSYRPGGRPGPRLTTEVAGLEPTRTEIVSQSITTPTASYAVDSASQFIRASQGGTVSIDNVQLEIGPGALPQDTEITISQQADVPGIGDRGVQMLQLEPDGLSFSTPARLSLSYSEPLTFNEEEISFFTFNDELSLWEELDIVSHDTDNNRVVVDVNHFSFIVSIFNRPVDVVLHLPGKYLQKGDLIYALTINTEGSTIFKWFPGHAAMYVGTRNASTPMEELDGSSIIESTPLVDMTLIRCEHRGVTSSTLSDFVDPRIHIYMGARRLPGLSTDDRTRIVHYALSALNRNALYAAIRQGNLGDHCYSCVGLTEAAYDHSGNSIIPPLLEFPFIIPLEQYIRTEPIKHITVKSGELVDFDVRRVTRNPTTKVFSDDSTVSISGCPSDASCSNGHFYWQTGSEDIGSSTTLHFAASHSYPSGSVYYAEESLTIRVIGSGEGSVLGQVVDATTGLPLSGVNISLDGTSQVTSTDSNGSYVFENVSSGSYTVSAHKEGFAEVSTAITVSDDAKTLANFSLPVATNPGDIVITLSWGEFPYDLDSHLWLPEHMPYHIYFENKGHLTTNPFAQLDVDDTDSYGPENVTIRQQMDGRYIYAVHNYSEAPNITTSDAIVTVVKEGRLVQTFQVPTTGSGLWWYVFDYDSTTGNIIPRNLIVDSPPGE